MKTLKEIELERYERPVWSDYAPVAAKCEKCGGQLYKNNSMILTTYPPQHQYVCSICKNVETSYVNLPETDFLF